MVKKVLIIGFILIIFVGYAAYDFIMKAPADLYQKAINGQIKSEWYAHDDLSNYLDPRLNALEDLRVQDPSWWRYIRIGDFKYSLPYRHPLYRVNPVLDLQGQKYGISFSDNQGVEMIRLLFRPAQNFTIKTPEKKFFEVPYVKHIISQDSPEQIWQELFVRPIPNELSELKRGIKDLYLLEQRYHYFPQNLIDFGKVENRDQTFYISLDGEDKDYLYENFYIKSNSQIYSFQLMSLKNFQSAAVFRDNIISSFELSPSSPEIMMISYAEFERLSRGDKQDEIGFLHLFSTWSQQIKKKSLIQEMIYYSEKNPDLTKTLKSLYEYSLAKYGKLYSHHQDIYLKLDDKLSLQRKIELEEKEIRQKSLGPENYIPPEEVDRSQTLKEKLRRARQMKNPNKEYRVN